MPAPKPGDRIEWIDLVQETPDAAPVKRTRTGTVWASAPIPAELASVFAPHPRLGSLRRVSRDLLDRPKSPFWVLPDDAPQTPVYVGTVPARRGLLYLAGTGLEPGTVYRASARTEHGAWSAAFAAEFDAARLCPPSSSKENAA